MSQSFAQFERKLDGVVADLKGEVSRGGLARVGKAMAPEIERAVAADIGDNSMSGWRRSGPIEITGTSRLISDTAVIVEPVKRAKGPMAVLERGRNANAYGDAYSQMVGRQTNRKRNKNGSLRKLRAVKSRRWNGTTEGKGTMGDASQAIKDKAPKLIAAEVHNALAKRLGGG